MSISDHFKGDTMAHGDFFVAKKNPKYRTKNLTIHDIKVHTKHLNENEVQLESISSTVMAPLCDIVPLYGCEKLKSQVVAAAYNRGRLQGTLGPEVNRRRSDSIRLPGSNSLSSCYISSQLQSSVAGRSSGTNMAKGERKSYIDLHYAKIGYPYVKGGRLVKTKDAMDTVRGKCGTETSLSNESPHMVSEDGELFEDAQSCLSDTTSFYANFMEKELLLSKVEDEFSDLKSVSQVSEQRVPSVRSNTKMMKSNISVPILGSLGPDIIASKEKLDILKKKQMYGQKVSEQNRIKVMERKILLGLKSEIRKSVNVDKLYLDKYFD